MNFGRNFINSSNNIYLHFRIVIVFAMFTTVIAVLCILVGISMDLPLCKPEADYSDVTPDSMILSLGKLFFFKNKKLLKLRYFPVRLLGSFRFPHD